MLHFKRKIAKGNWWGECGELHTQIIVWKLLGFMAQNLGYRHEETMLCEHGRARTKERQVEKGRKVARGCRASWHGRAMWHGVVVPRVVFAASLLGG